MTPDLVIFDCDGVLVDSEPLSNRLLARCFQAAGFAIDYDACVRDFVGLKLETCLEMAEQAHGRRAPAGFLDDVRARTIKALRQAVEPISGAPAAVRAISAKKESKRVIPAKQGASRDPHQEELILEADPGDRLTAIPG